MQIKTNHRALLVLTFSKRATGICETTEDFSSALLRLRNTRRPSSRAPSGTQPCCRLVRHPAPCPVGRALARRRGTGGRADRRTAAEQRARRPSLPADALPAGRNGCPSARWAAGHRLGWRCRAVYSRLSAGSQFSCLRTGAETSPETETAALLRRNSLRNKYLLKLPGRVHTCRRFGYPAAAAGALGRWVSGTRVKFWVKSASRHLCWLSPSQQPVRCSLLAYAASKIPTNWKAGLNLSTELFLAQLAAGDDWYDSCSCQPRAVFGANTGAVGAAPRLSLASRAF